MMSAKKLYHTSINLVYRNMRKDVIVNKFKIFQWSIKPAVFFLTSLSVLFIISYFGEKNCTVFNHLDALYLENRFDFFFEAAVAIIGVIITVMSIMIAITSSHYKIEIVELFIRDRINVFSITVSVSIFIFAYTVRLLNTLGYDLIFSTVFYICLLLLLAASYVFYTFYILSSQREVFYIDKFYKQLMRNLKKLNPTIPTDYLDRNKNEIIFNLSQMFDLIDFGNEKNNSRILNRLEEVFLDYRQLKRDKVLPNDWFNIRQQELELLDVVGYNINVENFFEDIIISELVDKIGQFIDNKDDSLLIRVVFFMIRLAKAEIENDIQFTENCLRNLLKILNVYYEKGERWKINKIIEGIEEIIFYMLVKNQFKSAFIKLLIKELQMSAILFYQKRIPVIIDRVALLIARLIVYLDRNPVDDLANELLVILLNIDRPLLETFSIEKIDLLEQKGRVVRIIQISVALYYLHKIDKAKLDEMEVIMTHALVKIIYNDMESEPAERIQLVRNDMENHLKVFMANIFRGQQVSDHEIQDYYRHMDEYFKNFEVSYKNTEKTKFKEDLRNVMKKSVHYRKPLGIILVDHGFIQKQQLLDALENLTDKKVTEEDLFYPENINLNTQIRIGDTLVEKGIITEPELQEALMIQKQEIQKDIDKFD